MKRIFIALLLITGSTQAGAFQGFDMFEMLQQSIECVRKPGTDMMICKPKTSDSEEDNNSDTTPEPVIDPTPEPEDPKWDLHNRERVYFDEANIQMDGCADPTKNYINFTLDVDLDGDQDMIFGFTCFKPNTDTEYLKQHVTYDEFYGWIADSYLAVFINNDGVFENDQSMFGGEYPVYDTTLKSWDALNVGDVNSDGYDDIVFRHHWDNSVHDIVNSRAFNVDITTDVYYNNAGSVMLSDGRRRICDSYVALPEWSDYSCILH